jgi:hypothetical protein
MESVEKATGSMPPPGDPHEDAPAEHGVTERGATERDAAQRTPARAVPAAQATAADPWAGLLHTGLTFLQSLQSATQAGGNGGPSSSLVRRDQRTGATYLQLPMPGPETIQQVTQALAALAQALAGRRPGS